MRLSAGSSAGLLGLEVLVGSEGGNTTENEDGVEADAETGGSAGLSSGSERTGKGSLGLGVTGLFVEKSNVSVETVLSSHANGIRSHICISGNGELSYLALQGADKEGLEGLAGLIRVTDILESLGRVLATDVKENLLTTAVYHKRKPGQHMFPLSRCRVSNAGKREVEDRRT